MTSSGVHYECPNCDKRTGLWEGIEVETWRGLNDQLEPDGQRGDLNIEWEHPQRTGNVGCAECGWEGLRAKLRKVALGIDGEPPDSPPRRVII